MSDTDTSDEAALAYWANSSDRAKGHDRISFFSGWQECRRRHEAKAETLKQEWQALLRSEHKIIQKLEAQTEERERKAFEFAFMKGYDLPGTWENEELETQIRVLFRAFKEGK